MIAFSVVVSACAERFTMFKVGMELRIEKQTILEVSYPEELIV